MMIDSPRNRTVALLPAALLSSAAWAGEALWIKTAARAAQ